MGSRGVIARERQKNARPSYAIMLEGGESQRRWDRECNGVIARKREETPRLSGIGLTPTDMRPRV
jgi:hypothetical protein